jgi:hypothetical protein
MGAQHFSSLQVHNLNCLVLLRDAIRRDPVLACYEHGLTKESANCYGAASDEELLNLAYSVDVSLFVPRFANHDLRAMLKTPPAVRGIRTAVSPNRPAQATLTKPETPGAAAGVRRNRKALKERL